MFRRRRHEPIPAPEPDSDPRWGLLIDEFVRATDADEIEWVRRGPVDWAWEYNGLNATVSLTGASLTLGRGQTRIGAYVGRPDLAESICRWVERQRDRLLTEAAQVVQANRQDHEPF